MTAAQLDVHLQIKNSSILVEPDIPIYDLREVMQQVGFPLEPRAPLFDKLQASRVTSAARVSFKATVAWRSASASQSALQLD